MPRHPIAPGPPCTPHRGSIRASLAVPVAVVGLAVLLAVLLLRGGDRGENGPRTATVEQQEAPAQNETDVAAVQPAPARAEMPAATAEPEPTAVLPGAGEEPEPVEIGAPVETHARVHGILIDQNDRLVPFHPILLATRERAAPGDLVSTSSRRGELARTVTDEAGRFELLDVPAGELVLAPLPASSRTIVREDGSRLMKPLEIRVAPVAVALDILPGETERYVELRGTSGDRIRGRVEFPDGTPAPFADVEAWVVGQRGRVRDSAGRDGAFAIGPLAEGEYALYAEFRAPDTTGPYADPEAAASPAAGRENASSWTPVRARAGEEGVVLVVTPGGGFDGRVIDAETGEPANATVFVLPAPGSTDAAIATFVATDDDGAFDIDDIAPTLYDLYVFDGGLEDGGRVGVLRDVQAVAGEDRPNVTIEIAAAAVIRLRYDGPAPEARASVHDAAGRRVCLVPLLPGAEMPWQVPPGALRIELAERGGPGRTHTLSIEAEVGGATIEVFWAPDADE